MTIDKRFVLYTESGQALYPYQKHQKKTKRFGFALTYAGNQDRRGGGDYTQEIEEVIRRVVLDGWGVRARAEYGEKRDGSFKLGAKAIVAYDLAPEFRHLVASAAMQPRATALTSSEDKAERAWASAEQLSSRDLRAALVALDAEIDDRLYALLLGLATGPEQTLSIQKIAEFGGYGDHLAAGLHLERLGRMLANYFGIEGLSNPVQILARGDAGADGHWQWTLRPPLYEALQKEGMLDAADDLVEVETDEAAAQLLATQRQALVNARLGQGGYRQRMLRIWGRRCALTGCDIECVLVASHAKPWRDSSNEERLDPYNGLLLSASVDRLFDQGLIAFDEQGRMLCSTALGCSDLASLGLKPAARLRQIHDRHKPYLQAHRIRHGFESMNLQGLVGGTTEYEL
jgi:hypothetical protein